MVPEILGHLEERRPVHDAGIADQNVQPPELADGPVDHGGDTLGFGDIGLVGKRGRP